MANQYVMKATRGALKRGGAYMIVPAAGGGFTSFLSTLLLAPLRILRFGVLLPLNLVFSLIRPSPYRSANECSGFGSMLNLAILILAGFLVFDRGFLSDNLPGWESYIGIPALMLAALAFLSAAYRSLHGFAICAFWLLSSALIGQAVIYPERQAYAARSTSGIRYVDRGEHRYFVIEDAPAQLVVRPAGFFQKASHSFSELGTGVSDAVEDLTGSVGSLADGVQRQVAGGVSGLMQTLSLDSTAVGRSVLDSVGSRSSGLPESAFFGRSLKGRKFYPLGGSRSPGLSGISQGIENFLGQ